MIGYADVALDLFDKGWEPLPLPYGCKEAPPRGTTGRNAPPLTRADVRAYCREFGSRSNVAVRPPKGVVGVDCDFYKPTSGPAQDWLREFGAQFRMDQDKSLPLTYRSSARTWPDGIRWYRFDDDLDPNPAPGIETIQWFHRYGVVSPSKHPKPEVERPYGWFDGWHQECDAPSIEQLADLNASPFGELLQTKMPEPEPVYVRAYEYADEDPGTLGEYVPISNEWGTAVAVQDTLWGAQRRMDAGWSRHETTRDALMALVGYRRHQLPGIEEAIAELKESFLDHVRGDRPSHVAESEWRRMLFGAEQRAERPLETYGRGDYRRRAARSWRNRK